MVTCIADNDVQYPCILLVSITHYVHPRLLTHPTTACTIVPIWNLNLSSRDDSLNGCYNGLTHDTRHLNILRIHNISYDRRPSPFKFQLCAMYCG
jgi:hypothetical protein